MQTFFHVQQFFSFSFQELGHRDARPLGDNLGDVILIDDLIQHIFRLPGPSFLIEIGLEAQSFSPFRRRSFVVANCMGFFFLNFHMVNLLL